MPNYKIDPSDIAHVEGHCWQVKMPADVGIGDSSAAPKSSNLLLMENGILMGQAGALHQEIINLGKGRYSHWENYLYFSSSDNDDPIRSGNSYEVIVADKLFGSAEYGRLLGLVARALGQEDEMARFQAAEDLMAHIFPEYRLADWGREFINDEKLSNLYLQFEDSWRSYDRKFNIYQLVKLVKNIPGDFVECGVYRGASASFIANAIVDNGLDSDLYLFDSFCGLSEPDKEKDGEFWVSGDMAIPIRTVQDNLKQFPFIKIFEGWIPERFEEVEDLSVRFLHLDVDLYAPTLESLEYFFERMPTNGVVLCDDYGFVTCNGAREAMDEFFTGRKEEVVHLSSGQGFVVKGK